MNVPSRTVTAVDSIEPAEPLFRLLAEQWPGALVLLTADLRLLWANQQAITLLGSLLRSQRGRAWADLGLPWKLGEEQGRKLANGVPVMLGVETVAAPEGTRRNYRAEMIPLREGGAPVSAIVCRLEEAASKPGTDPSASAQFGVWDWDFQQHRFTVDARWCAATALWGARAAFWQWHIPTNITSVSPLWLAMTGYTLEEWEDRPQPWRSRLHPEDAGAMQRCIDDHLNGRTPSIEAEYRIRVADGSWKWMQTRGRVVEWDSEGRPTSAMGVAFDIGALKQAERELLSTQARLETAVWGAGIGLWELDFRMVGARWFSDWCDRLDLYPCEGADHVARWDANIHPDDVSEAARRFSAHVAGEADYYDAEYRILDKNGRWRWLFERGRVVERAGDGKAVRMVGVCMDIDTRKEAELEYLRSQRRLEVALESARGGMWEWDLSSGHSRYTEYYCSMLGVDTQDAHGDESFWDDRVHPDDQWRVRAAAFDVVEGRKDLYEAEYRLQHADGTWRWVLDRGRAAERDENGRAVRLVGFLVDVTDRVHTQEKRELAEQAVRESATVLRAVAENTPDWLFLLDESLQVRFMNRTFAAGQPKVGPAAHSSASEQSWIGRSIFDFIPETHRVQLEEVYRRVLVTGEPARVELRYDVDAVQAHYEHRVVPITDGGAVRSITVAVTDVTERKRAESALRESQMTLQTVAASSADWLALFDRQRRCVFLNRTLRGVPPEAWIGAAVEDFAPVADRASMHEIFRQIMETGEPRDFDQVFVDPELGPRYFELRARAVQADGQIFGTVINITEVTERHAQQDVLRTQARILETMREGVVLVDAVQHRIKLTNPTFDRMFGYTHPELIGQPIEPLFTVPAERRKRLERTLCDDPEGTDATPIELECARRDGSSFMAACVITPLGMAGADHWLLVLHDITDRKRLEAELIDISNREQQRIGNDLHDGLGQELTGFALILRGLSAQLRRENSAARNDVEELINMCNVAIANTRSMARGLSPVSGEEGTLVSAVNALAARMSERNNVKIRFDFDFDEPLVLTEASATHVYRIVQEALTNVTRHSRAERVRIHLERSAGELRLRVDDDGIGFVPCAGGEHGLGLKIMRYRAQMLGGQLHVEPSERGVSVQMKCPIEAVQRGQGDSAEDSDTPLS